MYIYIFKLPFKRLNTSTHSWKSVSKLLTGIVCLSMKKYLKKKKSLCSPQCSLSCIVLFISHSIYNINT